MVYHLKNVSEAFFELQDPLVLLIGRLQHSPVKMPPRLQMMTRRMVMPYPAKMSNL